MSRRSLETLFDLVEIKLSTIQIVDREDAREAAVLENCRGQLASLLGIEVEPVFAALGKAKRGRPAPRPAP